MMELAELTAYAKEKYQMEEMHKWADFPGFSVLCHPKTGQWVALLMRQWDSDSGMIIERCDIKCGEQTVAVVRKPYLSLPLRMHGSKWIGVSFRTETEADVVLALLDMAVALGDGRGAADIRRLADTTGLSGINGQTDIKKPADTRGLSDTKESAPTDGQTDGIRSSDKRVAAGIKGLADIEGIMRGSHFFGRSESNNVRSDRSETAMSGIYKDSKLPKPSKIYAKEEIIIPKRIHEMLRLYEYGRESMEARARNFYRQAVFMQDYEDDFPWSGLFDHFYPTYHDMNSKQLRGYFSWRTQVRRGKYKQIPASAASIYIFELINGIGVESPIVCLEKMQEFEKAFLDAGLGGDGLFASKLKKHLRQWMVDYCVVKGIPPEKAIGFLPHLEVERNAAFAVLKDPIDAGDEEVFRALCSISGYNFGKSTAYKKDSGRMERLIAESWRKAHLHHAASGSDLFTICFGKRLTRHWYPFSNAVYCWGDNVDIGKSYSYEINGSTYRWKDGYWKVSSYESQFFDLKKIKNFLHEADSLIRTYLKSGRYLTEKPESKWAAPFIQAAIEDDRRASEEAAKPKITIDMSGLDKIRRDAIATRDSLLTEEERFELEEYSGRSVPTARNNAGGIDGLEFEECSEGLVSTARNNTGEISEPGIDTESGKYGDNSINN
ncbi:MAG: TerB N-terminal domain-containing protein, partial [Lachnospiraceae bacterium]|nr:TerB N-terminal domain-containing protein [Lachnospiraceae bacterium]